MRASATRITSMRKKSGRPSSASLWGTTATSNARPMFCCWQMSSRTSRRPAWGNMVWTRRTTTPAPAYLGMPSWRKQALSSSYWQTMTSTSLSGRACMEASQWCQSATPGQTTPELRAVTRRSPTVTSSIWTPITSMVGQWASPFQLVAFSGWRTVTSWPKQSPTSRLTVGRATSLRWTCSTPRSCTTHTMHILWHLSAW